MRRLLILATVLVIGLPVAAPAQTRRVEIILDVSGSMKAAMGSSTKMEQARVAIRQAATGLDQGAVVALRYYGHRVPQERKAESCRDTELVVPFQPFDRTRFLSSLDQVVPRGHTPTAYALDQAARDFGAASDEERSIVLVSDGEETCGGDPLATVRDLTAKGFKIKVHTIGFDADAAARKQLESISRATGGDYHDARDGAALAESLRQVTQKALLVQRDSTFGEETHGGNSYADAVPLAPGKTYHLDHHQRKNQFDYFAVEVRDGQKLVASIQPHDFGISIDGEKATEKTSGRSSGIAIHSADQKKISDVFENDAGAKRTIWASANSGKGGRFFILVGNDLGDQHKNSRFEVQLENLFDAGSNTDAGATDATAVSVEPGTFKAFLAPGDQTDYFKFRVSAKATYGFRVRPANADTSVDIEALDRDGVRKGANSAPNGGAAARIENVTFAYDGDAFLRVHRYDQKETEYTAEITQVGGPVATAARATAAPAQAPPVSSDGRSSLGWIAGGLGLLIGAGGLAYGLTRRR